MKKYKLKFNKDNMQMNLFPSINKKHKPSTCLLHPLKAVITFIYIKKKENNPNGTDNRIYYKPIRQGDSFEHIFKTYNFPIYCTKILKMEVFISTKYYKKFLNFELFESYKR